MKNSTGFTLVELIVTITLVGILVGSLIPTFNSLTNRTQKQVNLANMETIKNIITDNDKRGISMLLPHVSDTVCEDAANIILNNPVPSQNDLTGITKKQKEFVALRAKQIQMIKAINNLIKQVFGISVGAR